MDSKKFDIWLYGKEIGWWLQEEGYHTPEYACVALSRWLQEYDYMCGGAVIPTGESIDLPYCENSNDTTRELVSEN